MAGSFLGHGSLVVKVTDSWLSCHDLEPSTVEEPPCRGLSKSEDFIKEELDDADSVMTLNEEERQEGILPEKEQISRTT
ncbi:hypothetical protein TNCV_1800141 [Trichonephila clavipes]|nr:hypothetical protein TNCV_1800141 [Trichonephila clavipes]